LDKAFSAIADERVDALIVFPSPMLFVERKRVVDLATKLRLPLISMGKEFVQLEQNPTDLNREGLNEAAGAAIEEGSQEQPPV
jgi:hypothetical protein